MEILVCIVAWGIQIGCTLLVAWILGALAQGVEQAIRKKSVKLLPRVLVSFVLVCALLAALAWKPPVVCAERYEDNLTPEFHAAVQSVSSGLYSYRIPLVPVCVEVTKVRNFIIDEKMEYGVYFNIYYLYFGRIGMMYSTCDGYGLEDPLFNT